MNTDLLVVGGDGDLAIRKLYPSMFYLELNSCMPAGTRIIGMARTANEQQAFLEKIKKGVLAAIPEKLYSESKWEAFSRRISFAQADATNPESFSKARDKHLRDDHQLVVYLAIPPMIFGKVCSSLEVSGVVKPTTRLIVEKPLGDSRESFMEINAELARVFPEDQLFRIDHYLGKEGVQNLIALRFANDIFEPLWNSKYIEFIEITMSEDVGVGNRWAFYNQTGATRDMLQNHLLQVLCLLAMEPPSALNADSVRTEKLKVLNCLKPILPSAVKERTVRAQYQAGQVDGEQVPGFLEEESDKYEIDPNSKTETYVAVQAEIENWRWSGVPIYMRTGKRLDGKRSEIVVQFKQSHHRMFDQNHLEHKPNRLVISLQPDKGIGLEIMNKVAGLEAGIPLEAGSLNISFDDAKEPTHDAYSRLLFDVMRNDQTLFVSAAEVEAAWCWVDQIFASWKDVDMPNEKYESGSKGPAAADELMARNGHKWYDNSK
ncbi:MAG: glucose-6-phosphate dehydrogenase [Alteromonadaceae bacterium]|nr:MAG: glucose-6-phosphate dehydrogenase [Alteromonadaceae bacterium]